MLVVVPLRDDALSQHPPYLTLKHTLTHLVLNHAEHVVLFHKFIRLQHLLHHLQNYFTR